MHIRNLRELAAKVSGFQCTNFDLMKYSAWRIQTLVKTVLKDCCIELEDSAEEIDRAASSTNHFDYLKIRRPTPEDIARKYQVICSPSEESIIKVFPTIVPHLIQYVKEIFVDEIPQGQNGLRGLDEKKVEQSLFKVRKAKENNGFRELVDEVCEILHQLCMKNRDIDPSAEMETWGEHLAILSMLNFLKRFFQHCKQDLRLHKRLLQFSGRLRDINSNRVDIADDPLMRDFSDISQSLINFAKFDPSKLVIFELTGPQKCRVGYCESVCYDEHHDIFYQWFHIEKESEEVLQLHATALVHIDGEIREIGAFQSKIMLNASWEEAFEKCMVNFPDVVAAKLKDKHSNNRRVVLCSTQSEKLLKVQDVLKQELNQGIDFRGSEVTRCPLTVRTTASKAGAVVSLRLLYKWGSESIGFDSKDFNAFADFYAVAPEGNLLGKTKIVVIVVLSRWLLLWLIGTVLWDTTDSILYRGIQLIQYYIVGYNRFENSLRLEYNMYLSAVRRSFALRRLLIHEF